MIYTQVQGIGNVFVVQSELNVTLISVFQLKPGFEPMIALR